MRTVTIVAAEGSSQLYRSASRYPATKPPSAFAKTGARSGCSFCKSLAILGGCVWPRVWQGQSWTELFAANLRWWSSHLSSKLVGGSFFGKQVIIRTWSRLPSKQYSHCFFCHLINASLILQDLYKYNFCIFVPIFSEACPEVMASKSYPSDKYSGLNN